MTRPENADRSLRDSALAGLPHGPEFRFLDRIIDLEPGVRGTGTYTVPEDAPWLPGHFPGNPMMPGVLIVEAAAQLTGAVAQCDPTRTPIVNLRLASIRSIKWSGTAGPGETLTLVADRFHRLGSVVQARVEARVQDRVVLRGDITLSGG